VAHHTKDAKTKILKKAPEEKAAPANLPNRPKIVAEAVQFCQIGTFLPNRQPADSPFGRSHTLSLLEGSIEIAQ